ncbi:MAG: hypothetical protein KDB27_06040, partial [Planctomycetales bacterium]|nr:hypothetical protein [Planctomycetales bacterium]
MSRFASRFIVAFAVCGILCGNVYCQQFIPGPFFADDFEDGDHTDSSPANWMGGSGTSPSDLAVVDGSLEIYDVDNIKSALPVEPNGLPYWSYEDASVKTQVRIIDGGENVFAGVYGRS